MTRHFTSVLAVEGEPTGDGRLIQVGALTNRPLPLPLSWVRESSEGHDGRITVGVIDVIRREGPVVYGDGRLLESCPWELIELIEEGVVRPSIDPDDLVMELEQPTPDPTTWVSVMTSGRIMGATLVDHQAIVSTSITLLEPVLADLPLAVMPGLDETAAIPMLEPEVAPLPLTASTGAMVALVPSDVDAARMAVGGGLPADDLHLTLAYLGDADSISGEQRAALREALTPLTDRDHMVGSLWGHATFNPGPGGPEQAAVYLAEADGLDQVRARVLAACKDVLGEVHPQKPSFVPHVTAGYGLEAGHLAPPGTCRFDRMRVAFGNDVVDVPLGKPVEGQVKEPVVVSEPGDPAEAAALMAELEQPAPVDTAAPDDTPAAPAEAPADAAAPVEGSGQEEAGETPAEEADEQDEQAETKPALVASGAPAAPPREWFDNPGFTGPQPITVTDDGRVYGHIATWGTCHTGFPGTCVTAPSSPSGYAYFHTGELVCEGGERVSVGRMTVGAGHADLKLGPVATLAHYDNASFTAADVTCGEDAHGIWVAGALRSMVPGDVRRAFMANPPSGDWRRIGGALELMAAHCVNTPGYPVPRPRALVAAGVQTALVAAAAPARPADDADGTTAAGETVLGQDALVASVMAAMDRRQRSEALAAELGLDRASQAERLRAEIGG